LTFLAKFIYNTISKVEETKTAMTPCIESIFTLILNRKASPPLEDPVGALINTIMIMDAGTEEFKSNAYPVNNPNAVAKRLVDVLEASVKHYSQAELDKILAGIMASLQVITKNAPPTVREFLAERIFPMPEERDQILGKTDSFASQLIRIASEGAISPVGALTSNVLFDAADKDAAKFVDYIGYGNASGILYNLGIPLPQGEGMGDPGTVRGEPINPITGQRLSAERLTDAERELAAMTDEEKEQEAERLFVLFERLERNGVINVQNPLRAAMEEGRLEELPDDYEEK
jgi:Guanine nucleotide exchange factor synembryn